MLKKKSEHNILSIIILLLISFFGLILLYKLAVIYINNAKTKDINLVLLGIKDETYKMKLQEACKELKVNCYFQPQSQGGSYIVSFGHSTDLKKVQIFIPVRIINVFPKDDIIGLGITEKDGILEAENGVLLIPDGVNELFIQGRGNVTINANGSYTLFLDGNLDFFLNKTSNTYFLFKDGKVINTGLKGNLKSLNLTGSFNEIVLFKMRSTKNLDGLYNANMILIPKELYYVNIPYDKYPIRFFSLQELKNKDMTTILEETKESWVYQDPKVYAQYYVVSNVDSFPGEITFYREGGCPFYAKSTDSLYIPYTYCAKEMIQKILSRIS
jgi:hypothetical protein